MELMGTTSVTVRLPNPIVKFIDESDYDNRSEFLRHWANVGWRVSRDPDLSEALDWALDRPVQEPDELDGYRAGDPMNQYIGADTVAEVVPPEPVQKDELTTLRESQLEAMRNRVH